MNTSIKIEATQHIVNDHTPATPKLPPTPLNTNPLLYALFANAGIATPKADAYDVQSNGFES